MGLIVATSCRKMNVVESYLGFWLDMHSMLPFIYDVAQVLIPNLMQDVMRTQKTLTG